MSVTHHMLLGMEQKWGAWAREVPLPEPDEKVTAATHEILPRLRRVRHGIEAVPVHYRRDADGSWTDVGRVAAWARPKGTRHWTLIALTHLSARYPATDRQRVHSGHPAWRTSWVLYNPALVEPVEPPARYPSDYWRDSLSEALAEFARLHNDVRRERTGG